MHKFWLESPKSLFENAKVLPNEQDDINDKLNTLTKLVVIIAIILAIFGWRYWLVFLIIALLVILAVYLLNQIENPDKRPNMRSREAFNEDMNNFTYYANNLAKPKVEAEKAQVKVAANKVNNKEELTGVTYMTDIEFTLRPLDECYVHIKASESLTPPTGGFTFIIEFEAPKVEAAPEMPIPPVFHIPEMPKPDIVIQKKSVRDNAPKIKARKTASDLAREAYLQDYKKDEVDQIEVERKNMLRGLI